MSTVLPNVVGPCATCGKFHDPGAWCWPQIGARPSGFPDGRLEQIEMRMARAEADVRHLRNVIENLLLRNVLARPMAAEKTEGAA